MNDEIKVGDTVMFDGWPAGRATVLEVHGALRVRLPGGRTEVHWMEDCYKVQASTLCPERWANVTPDGIGPWYRTRESADAHDDVARSRIGVIHLSPNGDCEFIRTEEL